MRLRCAAPSLAQHRIDLVFEGVVADSTAEVREGSVVTDDCCNAVSFRLGEIVLGIDHFGLSADPSLEAQACQHESLLGEGQGILRSRDVL